jgi:2'-5' RNA ligase
MNAMADVFAGQGGDGWASVAALEVEKRPPGPVFFAINPDAGAALDAERTTCLLQAKNRLTGASPPPEMLHVSLLGIGRRPELRQEVVEAACLAATAVAMPPFEVAFDRAGSFSRVESLNQESKWPLVLFGGDGVIGVEMLQRVLISELNKVGFNFKKHSYEPHMTLLYDRRRVTAQFIAPVRWSVREFVLIHGLHGHARHIRLARWKLPG